MAVSGIVLGDINLVTGTPVRTRYSEQVRRVAPPELIGRGAELAELTDFCTAQSVPHSYQWWQGRAWAGKSALISWFVLHPPPAVRIVSFFVTSRLASQDDRIAFTDNLLEQLATLLDRPMPRYLTESTRDAHFLGLLTDAAQECRKREERLVLIVDGLDEDRGVTERADAHSIAALLPDPAPADMRVIVSGRPSPPIPQDVSDHHQLRNPAIVRPLAGSPSAAVIRADMERELKLLVTGQPADRELLGFLTAARGGLSGADLADLTDLPGWWIDDKLRTVTGRSFRARPSRWQPEALPDVYLLAHEELQKKAQEYLGQPEISRYRSALHDWAARYRDRGWPEGTPEYLLRGYYRLLRDLGDLERMVACATDSARHQRMLEVSGADNAALEEILTAQDLVMHSHEPDLVVMVRLAVSRDYLGDRNAPIPVELPAVLVGLGQADRAQGLARSIADPGRRALALVELVKAIAATGDFQLATDITQTIAHTGRRGEAAMALLRVVAAGGDTQVAESCLRLVPYQGERALGSAILAWAEAAAGNAVQTEEFAGRVETGIAYATPHRRAEALTLLAQAAATLGDPARAGHLLTQARTIAGTISRPGRQAAVWADIARATAFIDGDAAAARVLDEAEVVVRAFASPSSRAGALSTLSRTARLTGHRARGESLADEAEGLIRGLRGPARQSPLWSALLRGTAPEASDRISRIIDEAEATARAIPDDDERASAMTVLARAAITVHQPERARRLAADAELAVRSTGYPAKRGRDMAALVKCMGMAGMLDRAEALVRAIPAKQRSRFQGEAVTSLAKSIAASGDVARATTMVESMQNPGQRNGGLAALAISSAAAGKLAEAEHLIGLIDSRGPKMGALASLSVAYAEAGEVVKARATVDSIAPARPQLDALVELANALARSGNRKASREIGQEAARRAREIEDRDRRMATLVSVAEMMAIRGDFAAAHEVARSITVSREREMARSAIIKVGAFVGDPEKAESASWSIRDKYWRSVAQVAVTEAMIEKGQADRGGQLARKIQSGARSIDNSSQRDPVLVNLTRIFGVLGDRQQADKAILAISTPGRKAEALLALADLADAPERPLLVAEALQIYHWTASLGTLFSANPGILEIIADDITRITGSA